jgi:hypothetical protein
MEPTKDWLAKPHYQLATHVLEQRPKLLEACRVPTWFWVIKRAVCKSHVHHYEIMSANRNIVQLLGINGGGRQKKLSLALTPPVTSLAKKS